ncbi:hypothetical protein cypCar_00041597 [Cyprinus carpio]|nr:hypothetical protein cypCar_00041597 [Cyprinus carpio]
MCRIFGETDSLQHVLGDYGLVKPVLTDAEGRFLSHAVSVGPADGQFRRRWRREAALADHAHLESGRGMPERLYYNVTVFGREFHLRLHRNTRLVAPGAKMEWQDSDGMHSKHLKSDCMYVGDITDIQGASVAISNCDGLAQIRSSKSLSEIMRSICPLWLTSLYNKKESMSTLV